MLIGEEGTAQLPTKLAAKVVPKKELTKEEHEAKLAAAEARRNEQQAKTVDAAKKVTERAAQVVAGRSDEHVDIVEKKTGVAMTIGNPKAAKPVPVALQSKHRKASEENLTAEEIAAKHAAAEARRQEAEAQKVQAAKSDLQKVDKVVTEQKQAVEELAKNLASTWSAADERRDAAIKEKAGFASKVDERVAHAQAHKDPHSEAPKEKAAPMANSSNQ